MTQLELLNNIDTLLSIRESAKSRLRTINDCIINSLKNLNTFPTRWYVRNPTENVITYLVEKYGISRNIQDDCGFGELHGCFAFVPPDVDYSWEITQAEFNLLLSQIP